MKRYSQYNNLFGIEDKFVLYNVASDGIIVLLPKLKDILISFSNHLQDLKDIHPNLYIALEDNQMIVEKNEIEYKRVINDWKKEDTDPQKFSITINPTMNCNLRCSYCYEKHQVGTKMLENVMVNLKKLIEIKTRSRDLIGLNIDFFGGEPLLAFNDRVLPLLNFAKECCDKNQKDLYVSFTSNGMLLNSKVINALRLYSNVKNKVPVRFQITLDGDREMHNKIRIATKDKPTYDIIVTHIKEALQSGFNISVRLNYTNESAKTFVHILRDFDSLQEEDKKLMSFDFHKIWQDSYSEKTEDIIKETKEIFKEQGYHVFPLLRYQKLRCYADKDNFIVVNYNGNLYNCTARDFMENNKEGELSAEGDLHWNKRYLKRIAMRYGNDICHACKIFPICHGGCSQDKLESKGLQRCIRNYTDSDIDEIIYGRLQYLLNYVK